MGLPRTGPRIKFFLVMGRQCSALGGGKEKKPKQERAKESSARLCKAEQVFCFHDQCVQSHSIGELNNIQYAECPE